VAGALVAGCASSGGSSGSGSSGSGGSASAPIKIAYLGPQSGSLASTFGGGVIGAQTFVSWYNAHGGLDGHKLDMTVYDDASNPSTVLSNARLAVQNGAQAIISADVYFDSAASYLKAQNIPVFGAGITPGFYGADKQMFFSQEGNWIGFESDAQIKYLVSKGMKNIAVVSDPNPGNAVAAHAVTKGVTLGGGKLLYTNYAVDDTSSAALLSLAQRLAGMKAQAVYTNFYGTAAPQLQADLAQVNSKAVVVGGARGGGPRQPPPGHPAAVRQDDQRPAVRGLLGHLVQPVDPGRGHVHLGHEEVLAGQRAERRGAVGLGQHADARRGGRQAGQERPDAGQPHQGRQHHVGLHRPGHVPPGYLPGHAHQAQPLLLDRSGRGRQVVDRDRRPGQPVCVRGLSVSLLRLTVPRGRPPVMDD
jgi:hypothetical protein